MVVESLPQDEKVHKVRYESRELNVSHDCHEHRVNVSVSFGTVSYQVGTKAEGTVNHRSLIPSQELDGVVVECTLMTRSFRGRFWAGTIFASLLYHNAGVPSSNPGDI